MTTLHKAALYGRHNRLQHTEV